MGEILQLKFRQLLSVPATLLLLATLNANLTAAGRLHRRKGPGFPEILSRMDAASRNVHTVSANLDYTTVTVLVNDQTTESGQIFYRKGKRPSVFINFTKPAPKQILFRHDRAEIYLPNTNQIQEFDVGKKTNLLQQFLLLGFGTESGELKKAYNIKFSGETELDNEMTALIELTPISSRISSQLTKVELWISEESWLPVQQKFYEPSGDYLLARYREMKVNRALPSSVFQIKADKDAKRVQMN